MTTLHNLFSNIHSEHCIKITTPISLLKLSSRFFDALKIWTREIFINLKLKLAR